MLTFSLSLSLRNWEKSPSVSPGKHEDNRVYFLLAFGALEVQIRDVCASVLHMTVLILVIRVATFTSCVCFIFGSFGLCYSTNLAILRVFVLGITLRAFCTLGKCSTSELHTSTSNSQETG